jgi:flagellar biogenesis protein FliO
MLKKRILLIGLLLVLSIAGQILLRPCLGESTISPSPVQVESATGSSQTAPLSSSEPEFAKDTPELQSDLLRQFFYMLGFVAIIGIGAWLVCRKLSCGWSAGGQTIRIGETVRMGPRKALHLIRVGKKTFLVGSTSESFCLLADVSDSVTMTEVKSNE